MVPVVLILRGNIIVNYDLNTMALTGSHLSTVEMCYPPFPILLLASKYFNTVQQRRWSLQCYFRFRGLRRLRECDGGERPSEVESSECTLIRALLSFLHAFDVVVYRQKLFQSLRCSLLVDVCYIDRCVWSVCLVSWNSSVSLTCGWFLMKREHDFIVLGAL